MQLLFWKSLTSLPVPYKFRGWQRCLHQEEQGQSLVLLSLFLMILMAMMGLALDYGYATLIHRRMQVAADMSALAGARELADMQEEDIISKRIQQVLAQNGADTASSTYKIVDGNRIVVSAQQEVETFFVSIFGIESYVVSNSAEALVGVVASSVGIMPLAVEEGAWAPGEEVSLWGESNGEGNFGWVRWSGQSLGISNLRANIDYPERSDPLTIGTWVSGNPGVSFRPIQPNLNRWIGQKITVFLYDPDEVVGRGANLQYRVVSFAQFKITGTTSRGSSSEIFGTFLEYVALGGDLESLDTPGLRSVTLIR